MSKPPKLPIKLWENEIESYFRSDDLVRTKFKARVILDTYENTIFEILTKDSLSGDCWVITNDLRLIKHIVGIIAIEQYNEQFSDLSHQDPKIVFRLLQKLANGD